MGEVRIYQPARPERRKDKKGVVVRGVFERVFGQDTRTEELAKVIRDGLAVTVVDRLQAELDTQQATVLKLVGISPATYTRRRARGKVNPAKKTKAVIARLSQEESGRVYRVTAVVDDAVQLFEGDRQAALRWLKEPAKALGGATPLDYLDTEAGADAVRDLIGRLEHGVIT